MTADRCREWRELLGAYVLRQLSGDDRAAVRAHLDGCADCRAEAESLTPMPALLDRADPATLGRDPSPPPHLADLVARRIGAERRTVRRRRTIRVGFALSGAAAVAAVTVALVLASGGGPSSPGQPARAVAFRSLPPGVHLTATLAPRPWGTEVRMRVHGIRPGTLCTVWLRRGDGTRVPAGSFRYRYDDSDAAVLSAALPQSDAAAVGVRAGDRTFVAPVAAQTS